VEIQVAQIGTRFSSKNPYGIWNGNTLIGSDSKPLAETRLKKSMTGLDTTSTIDNEASPSVKNRQPYPIKILRGSLVI